MPIIDGELIRGTVIYLPINVSRFVKGAWIWGADAIIFNLEDSIPRAQSRESAIQIVPLSDSKSARAEWK